MKLIKLSSLLLITLIILGIMPVYSPTANAVPQPNILKKIEAYKILLERFLNIPDLPNEIRSRINKLLNATPSSAEEVDTFISEVKSLIADVGKFVESKMDLRKDIEAKKLMYMIEVFSKYAKEANETKIYEDLMNARQLIEKGEVDKARKLIMNLTPHIELIRIKTCSRAIEKSTMTIFKEVASNKTPVEAIKVAISNVNDTIKILEAVVKRLVAVNASEESIKALENAIEILNNTADILSSVSEVVEEAGAHRRLGNVTKDVTAKHLMDEIEDLMKEAGKIMNKTSYIEDKMNITLSDVRGNLTEALEALNKSRSLIDSGNLTEAIKLVARARVLIKWCERTIEKYTHKLEERMKEKREINEYILDRLEDLKDEYRDLKDEFNKLYNESLSLNSTDALDALASVNETLSRVSNILTDIEEKLNASDFEAAMHLLKEAENLLRHAKKLLDEVKELLSTVSSILKELLNRVNELREKLRELNMTAYSELSGEFLNATVEKLRELNETLSNIEEIVSSSMVNKVSKMLDKIESEIKKLKECIDKASEYSEKINELKSKLEELKDEYKGIKNLEKLIEEAERYLENASTMILEAINKCNPDMMRHIDKMLERINEIIEHVSGVNVYTVRFMIVDERGRPVLNASIVFNGTEYHNGDIITCTEGEYTLEAGIIPSGYVFDRWYSHGHIEIKDERSESTIAKVEGNGAIILRLKTTGVGGGKETYKIHFRIINEEGLPVLNASIVFNGTEYRHGDIVEAYEGNYTLSVGSIPSGYDFAGWDSEGKVEIKDTSSNETIVTIKGDGTIILRLKTSTAGGEKGGETYRIHVQIIDESGSPVLNASIIFNGTEYRHGDYIDVSKGNYTLSVGVIPSGYVFNRWDSEGKVEIKDTSSNETIVTIKGDGSIILRLKSRTVEKQSYEIVFHIIDDTGNSVENASIVFNGTEYRDGESVKAYSGEYEISVGQLPSNYRFDRWRSEGLVVIKDPLNESTKVVIEGDGSITLVLKKVSEKANVEFYIVDVSGSPIDNATIILGGAVYKNGDKASIDKGTYSLEVGTIPEGYTFKSWSASGEIVITNPFKPETSVRINGNGSITLVLSKSTGGGSEYIQSQYTINLLLYNMLNLAAIPTAVLKLIIPSYLS